MLWGVTGLTRQSPGTAPDFGPPATLGLHQASSKPPPTHPRCTQQPRWHKPPPLHQHQSTIGNYAYKRLSGRGWVQGDGNSAAAPTQR